jgi:hypothetical protein
MTDDPKGKDHPLRRMLKKWMKAPVFIAGFEEVAPALTTFRDRTDLLIQPEKLCLPFPCVRVLDSIPDTLGYLHFWCFGQRGSQWHVLDICESKQEGASLFFYTSGEIADLHGAVRDGTRKCGCEVVSGMLYPHAGFASAAGDPVMEERIKGQIAEWRNKLMDFLWMVNCPRHFVTKVSPSSTQCSTHSVEWVDSRSHYIILAPEHAQALKQGHRTFDGQITRSMHQRRAHFRTLTSERYKKKRWMQVWVRSSWVGPTEWSDHQNIYRIISPKRTTEIPSVKP